MRRVGRVDGAEHVELDAMFLEQASGSLDLVEDRSSSAVVSVGVVQLAGTVDAQADEDVVLGEEGGPLIVESVPFVWIVRSTCQPAGRRPFDFERAPEEVEAHERGLAALPGERHERHLLSVDGLANERLHLVGHAKVAARVERRLLEEEAVVAAQVAARPGRFGHHVERGGAHSVMETSYAMDGRGDRVRMGNTDHGLTVPGPGHRRQRAWGCPCPTASRTSS